MTAGYQLGVDTGMVVRREPDLVVYLANLVSGQITVAPGLSADAILRALGQAALERDDGRDQPILDALVATGLLVEVAG
ncbi:hypothetical protein [Branchiibius sp. NY16-3462-2]|uniref:hypothetical protein n=1 Tax=Branchiibius sp. NY16-3462-2 TaxID=1807500 RepID=UPI0007973C6E|nr:hypothetical protein [Branchiibius sp. NY16-3462-2]KYH43062.1 hypothetical protein AZH51_06330 [Branchiibius sp. NY16-3462-2]